MSVVLNTLTIKSFDARKTMQFYQAAGLSFTEKPIKYGSTVFQASMGEVDFKIMQESDRAAARAPHFQISLEVTDIYAVVENLRKFNPICILMDTTEFPDRTQAMAQDPDGNAVEIFEYSSNLV